MIMTEPDQYLSKVYNTLDAAEDLAKSISAESARHPDGLVSTKHGMVAENLNELKTALKTLKRADLEQVNG